MSACRDNLSASGAGEPIDRRSLLSGVKRVVVKVGSSVLASLDSGLDVRAVGRLVAQMAELHERGYELLLVSSGAVLAGMQRLGLREKPRDIPLRQAAAAIGQSRLMWLYEKLFGRQGCKVAQVLLTHDDLSNRRRYLNARNTLAVLLSHRVLPIVNENDTVVVEELKLGDNDNLSALVASLSEAELLVILSDIEGLCTADPHKDEKARLIPLVRNITPRIERLAGAASKDSLGSGGMITKLQAVSKAASFGIPTVIACARLENVLSRIVAGEEVGTLFLARSSRLASRKHWIAHALKPKGRLYLDAGAKEAILRQGRSLLASGIKGVEGGFERGEAVSCLGPQGEEFARGLVNYQAREIELIKGRRSKEIEAVLGYKYFDEIIHRDDLVLL